MNSKVLVIIVLFSVLFLVMGCVQQTNVCGNGVCESDENSGNCSIDCGESFVPDVVPGFVPDSLPEVEQNPELPGPSENGVSVNCVDSDSGKNSFVFGEVSGPCLDCNPSGVISSNSDICVNQDAGGALTVSEQSNSIMEFYCTSNGWVREVILCANNCVNGACIQ